MSQPEFSLKDFCAYLPVCLICNKELSYKINGRIKIDVKSGFKSLNTPLFYKDNLLKSKSKDCLFVLDTSNNRVVGGAEDISSINSSAVCKYCVTCDFKINTTLSIDTTTNLVQPLKLLSEVVKYTFKGGKSVFISKYYYADREPVLVIKINDRPLVDVPLELNKIRDFQHLNKRLKTLLILQ